MYVTQERRSDMGASKKIKKILVDKKMTQAEFASLAGKDAQNMRNMLYKDNMTFETVETMLRAIDCSIVFRDNETGILYE